MRTLIAIVGCEARAHYMAAQRDTWAGKVKDAEVRFFLAEQTRAALSDEVFLPCGDDYRSLPAKVREIMRWSVAHDFERTLKADDDTVIFPHRIQYPAGDYCGWEQAPGACRVRWCAGVAYWLRRSAMEVIAQAPLTEQWCEDQWTANALAQAGITPTNSPGIVWVGKERTMHRTPLDAADAFRQRWWSFHRTALGAAYLVGEFAPHEMQLAYDAFC